MVNYFVLVLFSNNLKYSEDAQRMLEILLLQKIEEDYE